MESLSRPGTRPAEEKNTKNKREESGRQGRPFEASREKSTGVSAAPRKSRPKQCETTRRDETRQLTQSLRLPAIGRRRSGSTREWAAFGRARAWPAVATTTPAPRRRPSGSGSALVSSLCARYWQLRVPDSVVLLGERPLTSACLPRSPPGGGPSRRFAKSRLLRDGPVERNKGTRLSSACTVTSRKQHNRPTGHVSLCQRGGCHDRWGVWRTRGHDGPGREMRDDRVVSHGRYQRWLVAHGGTSASRLAATLDTLARSLLLVATDLDVEPASTRSHLSADLSL